MHVAAAVETPAKAADEIHDGIEEAERAPRTRQHIDRVERAAEKRERRDYEHRYELELLEAFRPDPDDEAEEAEGRGGEHEKRDHPAGMKNPHRHEQRC